MEKEASDSGTRREISLDVPVLLEKLAEKEAAILEYESKLTNLYEDFNYNIELLNEREKEIENLTAKIDELIMINREKELENIALRSVYAKIDKLEHEKSVLNRRIEVLTTPKNHPRKEPRFATPRSKDLSSSFEHSTVFFPSHVSARKKSGATVLPLTNITLDIEKRIRELEQETSSTHQKVPVKLPNEPVLDSQSIESLLSKERELSALIRSLTPTKTKIPTRKYINHKPSGLKSILSDIETARIPGFVPATEPVSPRGNFN
jgi:hypothetical protein